jgi:hypothetical protein
MASTAEGRGCDWHRGRANCSVEVISEYRASTAIMAGSAHKCFDLSSPPYLPQRQARRPAAAHTKVARTRTFLSLGTLPAPPAQAAQSRSCTRRNKQAPRSYPVRSTALRASHSMGSIRPDTSVADLLRRAGSGWLTGKEEIPSFHMKGEFWVHYRPTLWSL